MEGYLKFSIPLVDLVPSKDHDQETISISEALNGGPLPKKSHAKPRKTPSATHGAQRTKSAAIPYRRLAAPERRAKGASSRTLWTAGR